MMLVLLKVVAILVLAHVMGYVMLASLGSVAKNVRTVFYWALTSILAFSVMILVLFTLLPVVSANLAIIFSGLAFTCMLILSQFSASRLYVGRSRSSNLTVRESDSPPSDAPP